MLCSLKDIKKKHKHNEERDGKYKEEPNETSGNEK